MTEYGEAIKRPFSDLKKLLIGCVLNIIPIVNFLAVGYAGETGKLSLKKKRNMPEWDNWGDLFVQGLLMFIIGLIWGLPLLILGGLLLGSALVAVFTGGVEATIAALTAAGGLFVLLLIVGLIVAYLLPIALFGFLSKGKFGEGFNFGTIFKKALTGTYAVAWIVSMVITIVLSMIGNMIPVVSIVLGPVFSYVGLLISMTIIGEIYSSL